MISHIFVGCRDTFHERWRDLIFAMKYPTNFKRDLEQVGVDASGIRMLSRGYREVVTAIDAFKADPDQDPMMLRLSQLSKETWGVK